MKLIVGLGNPGLEYAWTRHNAGWIAIDYIADKLSLGEPRVQFLGAFWRGAPFEGDKIALLKPHTYMNDSGKSVLEAARYFDIAPEDVLVIFDDVALPFGRVRYRDGGSAGGQKGMISIIARLDTMDIPRLRIGIGPQPEHIARKDHVLGRFPQDQQKMLPDICDIVLTMIRRWVSGDAGEGATIDLPSKA